jgi:hypothetical protein
MKSLSQSRMAKIEAGASCSRIRGEYLQALASGNLPLAFVLAIALIAQGCGPLGS